MEQNNNSFVAFLKKQGPMIKGLFIVILSIVMLIPTAFIMALVAEREKRQDEVINEISDKWAHAQVVNGPLLVIPYYEKKTINNEVQLVKRELHLCPEQLTVNGNILPEVKHRTIYNVVVYRSSLELTGSFDTSSLDITGIPGDIDWAAARISIGVNDAHGFEEEPLIQWGAGQPAKGIETTADDEGRSYLSVRAPVAATGPSTFRVRLKLKGTGQLYFAPVGKTTTVSLSSSWGSPAFDGRYLPATTSVTASGFTATWKILRASADFAHSWTDDAHPVMTNSAFGVRLIQEADHYTKTERSVKYAILIISLSFIVFFFMEMVQKRSVHPVQYVLVGLALVIFYTLLLSVSEYLGFDLAYVIASVATISLVGWYVYGIFRRVKTATAFCAALTGLYGYVFFLIQLKDYALLFGSIGLFIILAVIMYGTRNINWYDHQNKNSNG